MTALTPSWQLDGSQPSKAQLAIEALKASLLAESAAVTRGNEVRRKLFSERINDLMTRYTNPQLTAAQVIAELVEMAKEVIAEADRGKRFNPPLETDELAFYDVVALNEAAVDVMGDDVLARLARDLVATNPIPDIIHRRAHQSDFSARSRRKSVTGGLYGECSPAPLPPSSISGRGPTRDPWCAGHRRPVRPVRCRRRPGRPRSGR